VLHFSNRSGPHRKLLLGACMALLLAVPLSSRAQAKDLNAGTMLPPEHLSTMMLRKFSDSLAAKSGGKLKMQVHHSGVLGADLQMQSQLQAGTQDVMAAGTPTLAGQIKEMAIVSFPFLFQAGDEYDKVMAGPMGKLLSEKALDKGWVVLGYANNGFRQTTNSRRPIARMEDFNGLKLRVIQNAMYIDMFKQLGANPTPLPFTELFTALENRAVDGQENPLPQIGSSRMYEVQKYLSLTMHTLDAEALLISRKTWDRLSKDEQAMVSAAATEAIAFKRQSLGKFETQMLETVRKAGMVVNEVPLAERQRMAAQLQPVIERQKERAGEEFSRQFYAEVERVRAGK
jgi:tripartite ATP-independent transporter DctP family solute receptor